MISTASASAQPASQATQGGGERRTKRPFGESSSQPDLPGVTDALLKLALNSAQRVRELENQAQDSYLLPTEGTLVMNMEEAGRLWAQANLAMGKKADGSPEQDLGPPHLQKWLAMVRTLASLDLAQLASQGAAMSSASPSDDLTAAQKAVREHLEDLNKMTMPQVAFVVCVVKLRSTRDRPGRGKMTRLIISTREATAGTVNMTRSMQDIMASIRMLLEQACQGQRQVGPSPPSILERVVSDQLTKRNSGKNSGQKNSSTR